MSKPMNKCSKINTYVFEELKMAYFMILINQQFETFLIKWCELTFDSTNIIT